MRTFLKSKPELGRGTWVLSANTEESKRGESFMSTTEMSKEWLIKHLGKSYLKTTKQTSTQRLHGEDTGLKPSIREVEADETLRSTMAWCKE